MRKDLQESGPLLDEAGDLWISRKWLGEIMPDVRPADFLYLVCHHAGVGLEVPPMTGVRMRGRLRKKGYLPERRSNG